MNFPLSFAFLLLLAGRIAAQEYGKPDRDSPGDEMIQTYLSEEAKKLEADFLGPLKTKEDWERERPRFKQEYFEMLGLWPLPQKTELHASVTRSIDRGEYAVDMIHYQSRPGLYVTGNLYRPAKPKAGERLPAVLYVCGHAHRGRDGNKTAYQAHGIWFAKHGYICLMLDTLQLGEIAGIHHGTYNEGRWWWISRGYTPAGVECWNGIRGIDYLSSRPDVDPDRIAVTGISGGGAATHWISAADERVKVAVPVSGMADLTSYVGNRVINGHCDCMFLYNAYEWPWTRIAGLIAPRPLLFVNSDADSIFPMDANERVINRLERLYSLFGASDDVDAFVSVGGHAYREDIRKGVFRWLNARFKDDPRPVIDTEVDLVTGDRNPVHPIPPEQLRVFLTDSDIPSDARNAVIDREFVPLAHPEPPRAGEYEAWRGELLAKLRRLTFHHFPEHIAPVMETRKTGEANAMIWLKTEENISIPLRALGGASDTSSSNVVLLVSTNASEQTLPAWIASRSKTTGYAVIPRGFGPTRWTRKNPPNFVERAHYLLGRTVDSGRVWDIIATARLLKEKNPSRRVTLAAESEMAALAIYAAVLEPAIDQLEIKDPVASLMEPTAPAFLNALRVADLPASLGLIAPRPVLVHSTHPEVWRDAAAAFKAVHAGEQLRFD